MLSKKEIRSIAVCLHAHALTLHKHPLASRNYLQKAAALLSQLADAPADLEIIEAHGVEGVRYECHYQGRWHASFACRAQAIRFAEKLSFTGDFHDRAGL